jgi:hypothetical protein
VKPSSHRTVRLAAGCRGRTGLCVNIPAPSHTPTHTHITASPCCSSVCLAYLQMHLRNVSVLVSCIFQPTYWITGNSGDRARHSLVPPRTTDPIPNSTALSNTLAVSRLVSLVPVGFGWRRRASNFPSLSVSDVTGLFLPRTTHRQPPVPLSIVCHHALSRRNHKVPWPTRAPPSNDHRSLSSEALRRRHRHLPGPCAPSMSP